MYTMSRTEYACELAACFDEFSCKLYFGVSRDQLEDPDVWNQALEYAYQEYLDGQEEEE